MKKLGIGLLFLIIAIPSIQVSSNNYIGGWVSQCVVVLSPGQSGSWDSVSVFSPEVLHDGSQYRMWYSGYGQNDEGYRVGYAYSIDGVNWQKHASNPVLNIGSPGEWDDYRVWGPAVLFDDSGWKMWYTGSSTSSGQQWQIGLATSADGINWEKHPGNPVLSTGLPGQWDEGEVKAPYVMRDNGLFHMWYAGERSIGYATSADGIHWDRHPGNPVVTPDMVNVAQVRNPSVMVLFNEAYMWFDGYFVISAGNEYYLYLARSDDRVNWIVYDLEMPDPCFPPPGFNRQPTVVLRPAAVELWYMVGGTIRRAEAWLDLSSLDQEFFLPLLLRSDHHP